MKKSSQPTLRQIQKRVFRSILEPLTPLEKMRKKGLDGRSMKKEAEAVIKPNDRLSSFERLEIYNRQYWFRLLGCFHDDYPGLRTVLGEKAFERLALAYLRDCPSRSFTLRNLGKKLEGWLAQHPRYLGRRKVLALDMARLEWAHTEAFDEAEVPFLTAEDMGRLKSGGQGPRLGLQPYIRLLKISYPVDDILIALKNGTDWTSFASNAVSTPRSRKQKGPAALTKIESQPLYLAVHRHEFSVYYKRLEPEAYRMLEAFKKGKSLNPAILSAFRGSAVPFEGRAGLIRRWFQDWSSFRWFIKPNQPKQKINP